MTKSTQEKEKLTLKDYLKYIGPGAIMTGAIVGPGSVTTCSVQGANYGFKPLWVMLLSCIIAYLFQEPAVRVTIGCKTTIAQGIRKQMGRGVARLMYVAVLIGTLAFMSGNLVGAAMALTYFFPGTTNLFWGIAITLVTLVLAWLNKYKAVETAGTAMALLMTVSFVGTAFVSGPSITDLVKEGFSFQIPAGSAILMLSLLATTVVPDLPLGYSQFLKSKHPNAKGTKNEMKLCRADLGIGIILTFLICSAILICAGAVIHPKGIEVTSAADMADQLTPFLGRFAGIFFSLGLFGAAFTSVLFRFNLQPIVANPAFDQPEGGQTIYSKISMIVVAIIPIAFIALWGGAPVTLIIAGQAINGIILPLIVFLVWKLTSNKEFMQEHVNTKAQNICQIVMLIITLAFAINGLYGAIQKAIALL